MKAALEHVEETSKFNIDLGETFQVFPDLSYSAHKLLWLVLPFGLEFYSETVWMNLGNSGVDEQPLNFDFTELPVVLTELVDKGYIITKEWPEKELQEALQEYKESEYADALLDLSFKFRLLPHAIEKVRTYFGGLHTIIEEREKERAEAGEEFEFHP